MEFTGLLKKALLATLLGVAAIASSASAQTTITLYHYQTGKNYDSFRKLLNEFEQRNPDIRIKDIFSQSEQITAELQAAMAAGRQVDIATVIGKNIIHFLNNTPAVPLNAEPAKAKFLENYLPVFLDLGRVGEKIYAVPHAYGTPMIYYNKDIFRKAGLDPNRPPRTWDEVIQMALVIQKKTGVMGMGHLHAAMRDYGTMLMVTNAGGKYLSADGRCALFDSPAGVAGVALWQDLVVKYKVMPVAADRQMQSAFNSGKLSMYITSSASLGGTVTDTAGHFELGVANYPLFKDGMKRKTPNSGAALMLYSPPGERRNAALRVLAYLGDRKIANRWSRESGYMPLSKNPLSDPDMAKYVSSYPLVQPVIAQMADTVPTATWGEQGALEAQSIVSNLMDALWANHGPASKLVPEAVARMNAATGCPAR